MVEAAPAAVSLIVKPRETNYEEIKNTLLVLTQVCRMFGYIGEFNLEKDLQRWLGLAVIPGWMKLVKYKLAAFFAIHNDQTLPTPPWKAELKIRDRPEWLFGGRMGRFIRTFLKTSNETRKLEFSTSILQSKKGMPRVDEDTATIAEGKFVGEITAKQQFSVGSPNLVKSFVENDRLESLGIEPTLTVSAVKRQLRRTVDELFKGETYGYEEKTKAFFPSTSANYIKSRKNGGAVGEILRHPTLLEGLRKEGGYLNVTDESEQQRNERERNEEKRESEVGETRKRVTLDGQKLFEKKFQLLWLRILKAAAADDNIVLPKGLPEALKIRIITKGSPYIQTLLKPLQKKMWRVLKSHKTFSLLKDPSHIERNLLDTLGRELRDDEYFLSGDYRAATDGLKSWVSEEIAKQIGKNLKLSPVELRLFLANLTGNLFEKPGSETEVDGMTVTTLIPQTVGQLMGSITSFPVLCIANAALSRWSLEVCYGRKFQLKQTKMTINGDDIAMITRKERGYALWKQITAFAGLEESVGKTYQSSKFIQINSTNFKYDRNSERTILSSAGKPRQCPFELIKYVNMGLIHGQKRSGGMVGLDDLENPYNNIGTRYRELLRLCPHSMKEEAHDMFVSQHYNILHHTTLPWFIPEWLGGMGLIGLKKPNELDLRIAQRILYNFKQVKPVSLGNIGDKPWKVWNIVESKCPEPNLTVKDDRSKEGIDEYNQMIGKKCIDLLFDSNYSIEDLHEWSNKGKEDAIKRIVLGIRHNESLWRPGTGALPQPLSIDELTYRQLYNTYRAPYTQKSVVVDLD
jgi:hypothetical protein